MDPTKYVKRLKLKSLTTILKSTKVSGHLLLRESADNQISGPTSQLKYGFWDVTETFVDAESRLKFQKVIGYHQTSRAGIEDLFLTLLMKLMKMYIKINRHSSICRATGLNGVIL